MRSLTTAGLVGALAVAGAVAAPSAAAAQEAQEAPAPAAAEADYDAGTVLATVNGTEITLGHVVSLRERLPEQFQGLPDETLIEGLIDQIVDQELLARTVSEDPDDDPLPVRLHLENERRGTLAQQAVRDRIGADVDDAAVDEAYEAAVADFEPQTEFRASHIIVQTEEEAADLRRQVDEGTDFAELAREHSEDGAAERGGDLGWFGRGMMVPEFEEAVAEMEPGEVRGPVQTQFGWHLIRLEETRETEAPALEQIRPQIVEQVRQQRLIDELEALREEATIERQTDAVPPAAIRDTTVLQD